MLPYNYTLAYENSRTGMPLMRPLFFEDERNLDLVDNAQSYLWGDAFLVTPVTDAGVESVQVALPKGVWYDYFTGTRYSGGKTIEQPTRLEHLPVLVRAGSFIPMAAPMANTDAYNPGQLTLHYYHDNTVASGTGQMYEDDGHDPRALLKKRYQLLQFDAHNRRNRLDITVARSGNYDGVPAQREVTLVVHHLRKTPRKLTVDGESVKFEFAGQTLTARFSLNQDTHAIRIEGHR